MREPWDEYGARFVSQLAGAVERLAGVLESQQPASGLLEKLEAEISLLRSKADLIAPDGFGHLIEKELRETADRLQAILDSERSGK